jgi:hypothetical protein
VPRQSCWLVMKGIAFRGVSTQKQTCWLRESGDGFAIAKRESLCGREWLVMCFGNVTGRKSSVAPPTQNTYDVRRPTSPQSKELRLLIQ